MVGEPDAGKPHVRFDEGTQETCGNVTRLCPTLLGMRERVQNEMDRYSQFTPILRFILADAEKRIFRVERMCYRSMLYGWLDIHDSGTAAQLARRLIPTLGSDAFFELY
jgi:hypothetical protein